MLLSIFLNNTASYPFNGGLVGQKTLVSKCERSMDVHMPMCKPVRMLQKNKDKCESDQLYSAQNFRFRCQFTSDYFFDKTESLCYNLSVQKINYESILGFTNGETHVCGTYL